MANSKSKRSVCVICGAEFPAPDYYYERRTCSDQCKRLLIQRNRFTDERDISGKRFGRLIAIRETDIKKSNSVAWLCKCDCGNTTFVPATALRNGTTKSCGCWRSDNARITAAAKNIDAPHTWVAKITARGVYHVRRKINGRQYHVGEFETRESAEEMRRIVQQIPDDQFLDWLSDLRKSRKKEKALTKKEGT